jgi:hypothetical protein
MDEDLRTKLAHADAAFRDLDQRHREFDRKLAELMQKPYLSADDELREVELKKQKLRLKDQMEQLGSHLSISA